MITKEDKTDYSILNKYKVTKKGKDVAIIALGNFYKLGKEIADLAPTTIFISLS